MQVNPNVIFKTKHEIGLLSLPRRSLARAQHSITLFKLAETTDFGRFVCMCVCVCYGRKSMHLQFFIVFCFTFVFFSQFWILCVCVFFFLFSLLLLLFYKASSFSLFIQYSKNAIILSLAYMYDEISFTRKL